MSVSTVPVCSYSFCNCTSHRSYKLNQCLFVHATYIAGTAVNNLITNALT